MSHNSSAEAEKQPYQRIRFWLNNQFWHKGGHSQASKDYLDKWLMDWYDKEKSTHKFLPDIKRS